MPARVFSVNAGMPNILPFPDRSMRLFAEELAKTSWQSPERVRAAVRKCWQEIHRPEESPAGIGGGDDD